jgi:hypothetical protein
MIEVISPLIPEYPGKTLDAMHGYQTRLGDIQDVEILLAGLAEFYGKNSCYKSDAVRGYYQQRYEEVIQTCLDRLHQIHRFWRQTPDSPFPWGARRRKRKESHPPAQSPLQEQPGASDELPETIEPAALPVSTVSSTSRRSKRTSPRPAQPAPQGQSEVTDESDPAEVVMPPQEATTGSPPPTEEETK